MVNSTPKKSFTETGYLKLMTYGPNYGLPIYGDSADCINWEHTYSDATVQELLDKIHKLLRERKKKC